MNSLESVKDVFLTKLLLVDASYDNDCLQPNFLNNAKYSENQIMLFYFTRQHIIKQKCCCNIYALNNYDDITFQLPINYNGNLV